MEPWPGPHTGTKAFFGIKIFKFSKISGMIDMMSPMKSVNGEGVFLCLWAGLGLFKSTFFAIFNGKRSVAHPVVLGHFWPEDGHIWHRTSLSIYWFGVLVPWVLEEVAFSTSEWSKSRSLVKCSIDQWPRLWPLRGRKGNFFQYSRH